MIQVQQPHILENSKGCVKFCQIRVILGEFGALPRPMAQAQDQVEGKHLSAVRSALAKKHQHQYHVHHVLLPRRVEVVIYVIACMCVCGIVSFV